MVVVVIVIITAAIRPVVGVGGVINDRVIMSPRDVFISAGLR